MTYRNTTKLAALRDLVAMGAGVLGNLALQGRDAYNLAQDSVRAGESGKWTKDVLIGRDRAYDIGTGRAYRHDKKFVPLYHGHLIGGEIGKTIGAYVPDDESSRAARKDVWWEHGGDVSALDNLRAVRGNVGGRDVDIVPTGRLIRHSDSGNNYYAGTRDGSPYMPHIAASHMPALLHELGHHAMPRTPFNRKIQKLAPDIATLLHEINAQNWAEERMTDPRYHAGFGMDPPHGRLNPDASMADDGVAALRALMRGDTQSARERARELIDASAPLATYVPKRVLAASAGALAGGAVAKLQDIGDRLKKRLG